MRIEPATLEDLDRLADLWVDLAAEQRAHGTHLRADANRGVIRETLAAHVVDHTCLVGRAADGEAIRGFVSFALERDGLERDVRRGTVQNLYVEPEARGAGLGGDLLAAAEEALAAAGAERVVLEAMAANDEARSFYEARGYEPHRVSYERPVE